jgi:uncharacterized protein
MSRSLALINPWYAAEQRMRLDGTVDASQLVRTPGLPDKPTGAVHFELEFFNDSQRRCCVKGLIHGELWLVCQRCLQPVAMSINTDVLLAVVQKYEEANRLPDIYEPLVINGTQLRPLDFVEDEIILALPYIPAHPANGKVCSVQGSVTQASARDRSWPLKHEENPFQILEQIKKTVH